MGVVEEAEAMETEDGVTKPAEKKYYIDTNNLKVARDNMEMHNFLRDGMGRWP